MNHYIIPLYKTNSYLVGDPTGQIVPALHKELGVQDQGCRQHTFGGDFS